jgi:hypothetical protein
MGPKVENLTAIGRLAAMTVRRELMSAAVIALVICLAVPGCARGPSQPGGPPTQQSSPASKFDESFASKIPQVAQEARKAYPPTVTARVLAGQLPISEELEEALEMYIGRPALEELRSGKRQPTGRENDIAAACMSVLGIKLAEVSGVTAKMVDANYAVAPSGRSGWFHSGQEADIMLSGVDFGKSGGPLSFNHPKGICTDGRRLLLADGNNNRVLIWNSLPGPDTPPDLVLGQKDFYANDPGAGRDQLNWPVAVATDGQRIVVADTNNDRILIWTSWPTSNGEPASIVLDGKNKFEFGRPNKTGFSWPWGVWTDGTRLAISSTMGGYVYVWNSFPIRDNQPADLYLTAGGKMGTPRSITSDGKCLIIGDHNARDQASAIGNFVWTSFPTRDDQPPDFYISDPSDPRGAWMTGDFAEDGTLVMLGSTLHTWPSCPRGSAERPVLSVSGYRFPGGDGAAVAIAGNKVYVSLYNGNKVVVYNELPRDPSKAPDYAIGSPDIHTNTLDTHYVVTNGVPATDGKSLFVSSDFDQKLYVWNHLPDQSGAHPDIVYSLPAAPWDNELFGNTLVLAGKDTVFVWDGLPIDGRLPDRVFMGGIGGVHFSDLRGVALDATYLYLADAEQNNVFVWKGIPQEQDPPVFSIGVQAPLRLSSDGKYLVVVLADHKILLYEVAKLSADARPAVVLGGPGVFNLPQTAIAAKGALFVADTGFHRVFIWKDIGTAVAKKPADVVLGRGGPGVPPLPKKDSFFNPSGMAFDGSYLWLAEQKFSFRILRFSVGREQ